MVYSFMWFMLYLKKRGVHMKFLLGLILLAAFAMIVCYIIALITQKNKFLIYFRIALLVLITLLLITWITSILLKQHFLLLLILAIIFILLYVFS